jgi:hypothetical protein
MGLVETLSCKSVRGELKRLASRLFNNPELRAGQLYEFLRTQDLEVREYLQAYINDLPLTKPSRRDYSMSDSGD